jgi:S-(hydroxymethyl)glutathione dehydrogenase / alcohol dehydrogenase
MRAAVQRSAGGPFVIEDAELAPPGPGEVAVRLHAAGVCATDLALTTSFGRPTPIVLGHEGAGIVDEVGAGVEQFAVGDRVLVLWVMPCGHCVACRRGDDYLCSTRKTSVEISAGATDGAVSSVTVRGESIHRGMNTATFAERTVLPSRALMRLPDDVPFSVAAMLGCAVPTGVGAALRSARVSPGDTVAVIGCGAVGLNALFGALIAGAGRVLAVDPNDRRRQTALSLGAAEALTPEQLADLRDLDVVIDAVGQPSTVLPAWTATRRGGTVTVVGAGRPGDTVPIPAYELFHDDKRLTGSFLGGMSLRRDLDVLLRLWRGGRLPIEKLISGTTDLAHINDVVAAQKDGSIVRTVLTMD